MTTLSAIPLACAVTLLLSAATPSLETDAVFRAMDDELARSMKELTLEGAAPPYFMALRLQDSDVATVRARYGALVEKEQHLDRYLSVEVRVGDPSLDNTGFIGSWEDLYNMRTDVPEEDAYWSLRHEIWLAVDDAYKRAVETLSRKKAHLQTHPTTEPVPDFSSAPSLVHGGEPVRLEVDLDAWESQVREAGLILTEFPGLQDWKVTYIATASDRRYVNSEGSRHLEGSVIHQLEVSATTQAEDGERLTNFLTYTSRDEQTPPTGGRLAADIRGMAGDLVAAASAPTLDEYAGPVLFTDYAATQLISQLFVGQLTPARRPIAADERMTRGLPDPKLAGRLNRRVFPPFVSVTDEPTQRSWDDRRLAGYQAVDDEGVESKTITLVEEGRLVTLPMSRQPLKEIPASNGHARALPNQTVIPTVTNLFVRTAEPVEDLEGELRRLATESGNGFGILVTRLDNPVISETYRRIESRDGSGELLTAPVTVYKVYADDGRKQPVRGLEFEEVSIRALRDIVAMGNDPEVVNVLQPTGFRGFGYPAAILTPSILVEEVELTARAEQEPLPISANPMFEE